MITLRTFRNSDPPEIARLWNEAGLGRGAASGLTPDGFDLVIYSQPYFDPKGLFVAVADGKPVGFAHAGFGVNDSESALDPRRGVLCAVVVDPKYRRQGIGRSLVARAEEYLRAAGAGTISAGPAPGIDPFYVGIYGGSRPAGFLVSDSNAAPFFERIGYAATDRHAVFQRPIPGAREPVHFRLVGIRRKMELAAMLQPDPATWWWSTRFGRLDSLLFLLKPKGRDPAAAVATVTMMGLDFYLNTWQHHAVGLLDVQVKSNERRKGYAQALLLDIGKRLKDEAIGCIEMHSPESNTALIKLLEACGYQRVDTGVVYSKPASPSGDSARKPAGSMDTTLDFEPPKLAT